MLKQRTVIQKTCCDALVSRVKSCIWFVLKQLNLLMCLCYCSICHLVPLVLGVITTAGGGHHTINHKWFVISFVGFQVTS